MSKRHALAFGALQTLTAPVPAAAYLAFQRRIRTINDPMGISNTAYVPFLFRCIMHASGARPDPVGRAIADYLPALSPRINRALIDSPTTAARLTHYQPSIFGYPSTSTFPTTIQHRTRFFDRAMEQGMANSDQVVILGAGWDTRLYDSTKMGHLSCFEVDQPPTQQAKIRALDNAGVDRSHVRFVPTDFQQRSWFDSLVEHGFDANKSTFILWEGVTMYLDRPTVDRTLQQVSQLAPNSSVAFDYLASELVQATAPFRVLGRTLKTGMKLYNERFSFGIDAGREPRDNARRLLENQGLALMHWEPFGNKHPYGGLVHAGVLLG